MTTPPSSPTSFGRAHARITQALIDAARRTPNDRPLNSYLTRRLPGHVADGRAWQDLAAAPDVLDRIDPDAVAEEALRTAFGQAELPTTITAVLAVRDQLSDTARREHRTARRQLAVSRLGGPSPTALVENAPLRLAWHHGRSLTPSVVLGKHPQPVSAVAAVPLPDGRTLLATGSDDHTVRLWDPTTGAPAGETLLDATVRSICGAGGSLIVAAGDSLFGFVGQEPV